MPRLLARLLLLIAALIASATLSRAQQPDPAQLIAKVDASVKARLDAIASYTVTEHYSIFRSGDQTHPAAEMTVKTTYKRESGKTYQILSESGSDLLRHTVLRSILSNEQEVNRPGIREGAFFTSSNYFMTVHPSVPQPINSRNCYLIDVKPRPNSQHLVSGTLAVEAATGQIVQVEGKVQKNLSFVTGNVQVFRKYSTIDGFAQATYARAESNSMLFGRTVVTIDYRDYQIETEPKP